MPKRPSAKSLKYVIMCINIVIQPAEVKCFVLCYPQEIVTALKGKKNIVPVTDNFVWPSPDSLPEDMNTILKFNGIKWVNTLPD